MTTDWVKLQSQVIDLVRFPMIVAVVVLHYGAMMISDATGPLRVLCIVFEEGICRLAVPCFFLISGYLFFQHLQKWDWIVWKEKIRRRARTLFVPYILWILLTFLILYFYNGIKEQHLSIFSFFVNTGGLRIFWGINGKIPIGLHDIPLNGPLWFIRDLILFSLATPLIYFFIKQSKRIGVLAFCLIFLFFQGIIPEGFIFFLLGAYLQIEKRNILQIVWPKRFVFYGISALLLIVFYFFFDFDYWSRFIKIIFFFVGIGAAFCIATELLRQEKIHVNPFLAHSSLFILATHEFLIRYDIVPSLVRRILPANGQGWACFDFFLTPAVTIMICLAALFIMSELLPRTTGILTGNRD